MQKNVSLWFDNSMDRIEGWYKRTAQKWTFIIAVLVVLVINVDTFTITKALWNDDSLREATAIAAEAYIKPNPETKNPDNNNEDSKKKIELAKNQLTALNLPIGWTTYFILSEDNINNLNNILFENQKYCRTALTNYLKTEKSGDAIVETDLTEVLKNAKITDKSAKNCNADELTNFIKKNKDIVYDKLKQGSEYFLSEDNINNLNNILIKNPNYCGTALASYLKTEKSEDAIVKTDLTEVLKNAKITDKSAKNCNADELTNFIKKNKDIVYDKLEQGSINSIVYAFTNHWLGWLFTAFAVSFGAPFWFDILNKLTNIRAAGSKPKKKKGNENKKGK